jgi:hypothetical protein
MRHALPVLKTNHNLNETRLKPDVELELDSKKWCLDVAFASSARAQVSYNEKISKYTSLYNGRVIPLIVRYNGTIYEKSHTLIQRLLPELTHAALS